MLVTGTPMGVPVVTLCAGRATGAESLRTEVREGGAQRLRPSGTIQGRRDDGTVGDGVPLDVAVGAASESGQCHAGRDAVRDPDDVVMGCAERAADRCGQAEMHVLEALAAAPLHLADVAAIIGFGSCLEGGRELPLEVTDGLLPQVGVVHDVHAEGPGDDIGGLTGPHEVARHDRDGPVDTLGEKVRGSLRLGATEVRELGVGRLALEAALDVPDGLAVADEVELERAHRVILRVHRLPDVSGLLVTGTSSDAGKSLVVTALCRLWSRQGIRVAPFKSQNMSNNSMVCRDGSEIGRAQYLQAQAAGVEPTSVHNPVLLKPGSDRRAFVVVRGKPAGQLVAGEYATGRRHLAEAAFAAFEELSASVDLIVAEGAGSPAEVNLRSGDYVNLGLAQRFSLPALIVADIDRGGALAALFGTWGLVDDADRALLSAYVINKFRGDESVLTPGLDVVTERTGMPCAGVLPWLEDVWLDSEDALSIGRWRPSSDTSGDRLSVAVVRFPRTSNATDVDALAAEPGVDVRVTTDPDVCREADLLVLPGSRATVSDLEWLRSTGLAEVVTWRASRGRPVLGICGGYEMLAEWIDDPVEGELKGRVAGLALLPTTVTFLPEKVLARPTGEWRGHAVEGYEIHHGVVSDDRAFPGGTASGAVWGTIWHGTLECDDFRRAWLSEAAAAADSSWRADPAALGFAERRESMIDALADAVDEHLDHESLLELTR